MRVETAKKILTRNGIKWNNYFQVDFIERARDNWIGCEDIHTAIKRIKQIIKKGGSR